MPAMMIQANTQHTAADVVRSYVDFLQVRSPFTVSAYHVALRHFTTWLQLQGVQQITRPVILSYAAALDHEISPRTGKLLSAGTKAQYLRAVKAVFSWASAEGIIASNPAANVKGARVNRNGSKRDAFTADDMRRIIGSIDRSTQAGKRDYAIMLAAVTCGLRVIEMQRANIEDLQTIAGKPVLLIQGKGHESKDDYKKIVPQLKSAIDDYLATRPERRPGDPLFTSTSNRAQGKRITEPGFSRMVKQIIINAGYDSSRLTAHSLRHTSITLLLLSGASLQQAQDHARHCNPATTEVYAHNLDKISANHESVIYGQIYGTQPSTTDDDPRITAAAQLANMTPAQAAAILRIMQQIK